MAAMFVVFVDEAHYKLPALYWFLFITKDLVHILLLRFYSFDVLSHWE